MIFPEEIMIRSGIAIMLLMSLSACGGGGDDKPDMSFCAVTYSVTGTAGRAAVTYQTSSGGTAQEVVTLPWNKPLQVFDKGDFMYLSAQSQSSSGTGSVTVTISGDNTLKTTTSIGAFTIASASGSCTPK
jgi:hypothetical protein